jgi:hypothetical protein
MATACSERGDGVYVGSKLCRLRAQGPGFKALSKRKRGTAGYDGMCRPRQYQDFVFVGSVFAGTLSPQPMDSRTDGALGRVFHRSAERRQTDAA